MDEADEIKEPRRDAFSGKEREPLGSGRFLDKRLTGKIGLTCRFTKSLESESYKKSREENRQPWVEPGTLTMVICKDTKRSTGMNEMRLSAVRLGAEGA